MGEKEYELSNHLGNVLVTITDKKVNLANTGWIADVASATDYFAFGASLRSSGTYRYGFNGKENDKEWGTSVYGFEFREFDARIIRFYTIDPKNNMYSWQSPYVYHRNSPIGVIDYLGGGDEDNVTKLDNNTKDRLSTLKGNFMKFQKNIRKANKIINAIDDIISASEGGDQKKMLNGINSFVKLSKIVLGKGSLDRDLLYNKGLMLMVMPLLEKGLETISQGLQEKNKALMKYGIDDVYYAGAFLGGQEFYNFMSQIKGYREESKDQSGEISWGNLVAKHNGKLVVPNRVQQVVKDNYEFFALIMGSSPPYETKSFMGVDILSKDRDDGNGFVWFFANFETIENSVYGGLKVK